MRKETKTHLQWINNQVQAMSFKEKFDSKGRNGMVYLYIGKSNKKEVIRGKFRLVKLFSSESTLISFYSIKCKENMKSQNLRVQGMLLRSLGER